MALILVIDDDSDMVNLIKKYLGDAGHQIMSAPNPIDAAEIIEKYRITVAIVDVNMPHQSGFDFVEQVRRSMRNRFLPVIFLTGRSEKKDIARAAKLDIDGYIIKPIEPKSFVEKINSVVKKYENAAPDYSGLDITKDKISGNLVVPYFVSIESISEVGLTVLSPHDIGDLERNPEKLLDMHAPIWAHVGIEAVQLKVTARQWIDELKQYRYTLFFKTMSQENIDNLTKWIARRKLQK